jgi:hypothetical protein
MVLSVVERIKGFLFSPSGTFDASKEDTLGDAFKYFIAILAIYALLSAVVLAALYHWMMYFMTAFMPYGTLPPEAEELLPTLGPLFAVAVFIVTLVGGIIGIFVSGLWTHIWVYLVGGRNGLEETIKAVMYGDTPCLILGWIPIFNIIAGIWALIVSIIGVRQLHVLSTGKAALAVILALAIPLIIYVAILAAFIAAMQGPGFPVPTGPVFGGI